MSIEHDYSKMWALAPSWARWIATDSSGERYFFESRPEICNTVSVGKVWDLEDGNTKRIDFDGNGSGFQDSLQEIPERERELNRLADDWDVTQWAGHCGFGYLKDGQLHTTNTPSSRPSERWNYFTREEWQERRRIRLEAGLIKCDQVEANLKRRRKLGLEPDDSAGDNLRAAAEEAKLDTDNSEGWVPDIGGCCEMKDSDGRFIPVKILAKENGFYIGWALNPKSMFSRVFYSNNLSEFRPIETEAQKAERERQCWVDMAIARAEQDGAEGDASFAGAIYDWLKETNQLKGSAE